jgi:hypothetical protein
MSTIVTTLGDEDQDIEDFFSVATLRIPNEYSSTAMLCFTEGIGQVAKEARPTRPMLILGRYLYVPRPLSLYSLSFVSRMR